jgi:hypothetical protein
MRLLSKLLITTILLTACSSLSVEQMQQMAQAKAQEIAASVFRQQLGKGVKQVIAELAQEGGYLDDPLVRIVMPPPLGLVIDVAQDFHKDPQAALLETLINHAAEQAIPVAGPILASLLENMDTLSTDALLNAGETAATDYLKKKSAASLELALKPVINEKLETSGAIEIYHQLLAAKEKAEHIQETVNTFAEDSQDIQDAVSANQLDAYITTKATDGLFRKLAQKERDIRNTLNQL